MTDKKQNTENLEAQVVVVGGGAAGLCAAVAAAEKGADVILLEKAAKPGGNSAMAGAFFACNSPLQQRLNIKISTDEIFKRHMDFCHYAVDPKIVRAFLDKSGDTIGWLEEKGIRFELDTLMKEYRFGYEIPPIAHMPEGFGRGLIESLTKIFEGMGGRLICGARVFELITDKNGVTGVIVKRKGTELKVKTKSVILASGGYAGNKKLLKKYAPQYSENMQISGYPNMGEGLLMALKAGAATDSLGVLHIESKGFYPTGPEALWNMAVNRSTVSVNKRGERFADEGIGSVFEAANPVLRQPDKMSYTLFDKKIMDELERLRIERGGIISGRLPKGEKVLDTEGVLKLSQEKGLAKIANSWDEIAKWIGCDPKTLQATIDEYNSFCDKGRDDIFLKDPSLLSSLRTPPYYAIKCVMRIHCTAGGIKINQHMEVMNQDGKPIPGLYATGIEAGGWVTETYDRAYIGGAGLGFPVNSGRIAGENAVTYVTKRK